MKLEKFTKEPSYTYECFDKEGKNTTKDNCVAYNIINDETNVVRYYIMGHGRFLYDVQSCESNYKKKYTWKLMKVNKDVYDSYIRFLTTKHRRFITTAERHIRS